jgi:Tfp pilus assembly protein PilN
MVRLHHHLLAPRLFLMLLLAAGLLPGCGIVPRSRMEESRKLSQLLRSENAHLKDQVLALQSQNRDYADRAVDDLRRLTAREQAIERLERSVQAYQQDRERLAAAYEQLTVSLGHRPESAQPVGVRKRDGGLTPHRESESWEPEPPSRKGITRGEDEDASR